MKHGMPWHCRYADGDKVALNIGFYYMANALGRLTGRSAECLKAFTALRRE